MGIDLRREISVNIKRLVDLACYGDQDIKKLPVRGQKELNVMPEQEKESNSNCRKKLTPLKKIDFK